MKRPFIILVLSFAFATGLTALTSAPLTRDGWLQLTAPFANNFAVSTGDGKSPLGAG